MQQLKKERYNQKEFILCSNKRLNPVPKFISPKICLSMIVKDEALVIKRCINALKDYIHYWVIQDNGSTDGTQKIIIDYMKELNIPGELYETGWTDFSTNRNDCIERSRKHGEYILIMDADDILEVNDKSNPFVNMIEADEYLFNTHLAGKATHSRFVPLLFKASMPFKFIAVLHEMLDIEMNDYTTAIMPDSIKVARSFSRNIKAGGMDTSMKNDLEVLTKALQSEKTSRLIAHYKKCSGDCFLHLKDPDMAIKNYLEAFNEYSKNERSFEASYDCLLYAGRVKSEQMKDESDEETIELFQKAMNIIPHRLEAYFYCMSYLCQKKDYLRAYTLGKSIMNIEFETSVYGTADFIYSYGFMELLGKCAIELCYIREAKKIFNYIKSLEDFEAFPDDDKKRLLEYCQYLS